jgi:hypothetical protein
MMIASVKAIAMAIETEEEHRLQLPPKSLESQPLLLPNREES